MFKVVCYRPDECQVITAGTDKNVRFFFMSLYTGVSHKK